MSKKRFLVLLSVFLIVLASLAISSFKALPAASEAASDFHQRHPDWTWSANAHMSYYRLDCFRRELQLKESDAPSKDASNFFMDIS